MLSHGVRRFLTKTFPALGLGGTALYWYDPMIFNSAERTSRALFDMATVAVQLKYAWYQQDRDLTLTDEQKSEQNRELHQKAADRILKLCETNKGLYIKVGQSISTMNHILPQEYTQTLKKLQDHAPTVPFSTMQSVITEDLKMPFDQLFSSFEETPIAAASLAQVHRAVTKDGQKVAVKIQFPELLHQFDADMFVHLLVLKAGSVMFPGFDFEWMQDEVEGNLRKELNFVNEAQNAERTARNFRSDSNVHIPEIKWTHTSKRVLTMEFIEGCKVTDQPKIRGMGFNVAAVCQTMVQAMSEMIFNHGFVHCDPHPGNLLVRPNPKNPSQHQLVILDHGLYREMSDQTRRDYADFWLSLILHHDQDAQVAARKLGVSNWYLFALSVLMRPYKRDATAGLADIILKDDVVALRRQAHKQQREWMDMLRHMPRELLLVLRNQNYARALCTELGEPVNRFRVMARSALSAIEQRNDDDNKLESDTIVPDVESATKAEVKSEVILDKNAAAAAYVAAALPGGSNKSKLLSAATKERELAQQQLARARQHDRALLQRQEQRGVAFIQRHWNMFRDMSSHAWQYVRGLARRFVFEASLAYSDAQMAAIIVYARMFHAKKYEMLMEQIRTQDQAMLL